MKQLLKSVFCVLLLMTPAVTLTRNCSTDCSDACSISCSTGCSTGCSDTCSTSDNCSDSCARDCYTGCGNGYVHYRSQGANTARELVGVEEYIYNSPLGGCGVGAITFEYMQSFNSRKIAQNLFGTDTLYFQGSAITGDARIPGAFVADYFGLPRDFSGSARIRPKIKNFIVDFSGYFPLDNCNTWFFRFNAPLVHTRWDLGLNRCTDNVITASNFGACQLAVNAVPTAASLEDALSGNFAVNGNQFLCNGIFPRCTRSKTGFADIDLILGGYFYNDDCGHLGLYGQLVLPTGNRQNGREIFKPIVGNGKFLEFGLGITGHSVLWQDACDQQLAVYLEGNVTHMFSARQCRLLDFCGNGAFSRYLLLREFQADGVTPTGNLVSATCFNNRQVDVKVNVKGDASLKFAYQWCNWNFDLGYNIYGHSRETVRFSDRELNGCNSNLQKFGIAGSNGVCCNTYDVTITPGTDCLEIASATPSATALSNATFSGSATAFNPTPSTAADLAVVPTLAPIGGVSTVCLLPTVVPAAGTPIALSTGDAACITADALTNADVALASANPVILKTTDLNPQSAAACSNLTNKVFGYASYAWTDCGCWTPSIGIGAEGEWGSCKYGRAGLSQWGVLLKGVVTF